MITPHSHHDDPHPNEPGDSPNSGELASGELISRDLASHDLNRDEPHPADMHRDYRRIASAIRFLQQHFPDQPSLADVADQVHLSEFHLQRLFTRWAGVSPKRFLQFLTKEYAKDLLRQDLTVEETSYRSGLSSPSRLHDLLVECDGIAPGEYRQLGPALVLQVGFHATPFGECLLAESDRGVNFLAFVDSSRTAALAQLKAQWPQATLQDNPARTAATLGRIFNPQPGSTRLRVAPRGTNFQIKVWEALLRIQPGQVQSYRQLAAAMGQPSAARAVGGALASNSIGFLIPCHRVILGDGSCGHYRWGSERKAAMLGWEQAALCPLVSAAD